ncbi:MAG: hypothetical protein QOJ59_3875 [Thermomicrobiales bacterium]|nr:hypothetical protein [Thermomicrobiales bacterium]MEA2527554.1 hypothetical protein [Thermomicrobiales bacterium]
MAFEMAGQRIGSGETGIVQIPVCTMANTHELSIAVHVLDSGKPGPTLAAVATHHGEEVFTIELLRRLKAVLLGREFRGTMLLMPLMNPVSFAAGTRNTPTDMHNLNRVFPGNPDGWYSDILADAIWTHLVPKIDGLLDYHCGGVDTSIHYTYTLSPDTEFGRQVHELALLASAEVLYEVPRPVGSLAGLVAERNIPTATQEIGGGTSFGTDYMDRGVESTLRILTKLGMLDGTVENGPARVVCRKGKSIRPHHGGLYLPEIGMELLGKTVPGGTILGRVVSAATFEELEVIRAPFPTTEIMMVRSREGKVEPGDYAYILGDGDSGYTIQPGS